MPIPQPSRPPSYNDLLTLVGANDEGTATPDQRRIASMLAQFLSAVGGSLDAGVDEANAVEAEETTGQFDVALPIPFIGLSGEQTLPRGGSNVSVGMAVRIFAQRVEAADYTTIATRGPASAFVVEVTETTIKLATGAASGPMRVVSPVVGSQVMLYTAGMGTCDASLVGTGLTQIVATCVGTKQDQNKCVKCQNLGVGMISTGDFPDGFFRFNFDNVQLTVPGTGVINTTYTGSTTGYLVSFENTNGAMATGTLLATRDGLGVAYRAIGLSAAGGFSAEVETGVAVSGESDGPVAFTASFFNNDAGGRHFQAGPDVVIVGSTIKMNWSSGSSFYGTITHATLTAARTWTFQDATGTIPLLEVAQTWTATQTIGAAAWINFTPSTTQVIDAAGDTILANAGTVNLSNVTGNITLTSTPTIADGADGQDLVIHNLLASTSRVVLQAESGLAGSNLYLGAATRTLLPGGMIHLRFLAAESRWVEIAFVTSTS